MHFITLKDSHQSNKAEGNTFMVFIYADCIIGYLLLMTRALKLQRIDSRMPLSDDSAQDRQMFSLGLYNLIQKAR